MKKRTLCLLLCLTVLLGCGAAAGFDDFTPVREYMPGTFTDAEEDSWYGEAMKTAYELELIEGTAPDAFSPTGEVTMAEAVAMAARLHSLYHTGTAEFVQGEPWYWVYFEYARDHGAVPEFALNHFAPGRVLNRREFVCVLSQALPAEALEEINHIPEGAIPDENDYYWWSYDAVYRFYRAGVLTGHNEKGAFRPEEKVLRREAVCVLMRLAQPETRRTVVIAPPTLEDLQGVWHAYDGYGQLYEELWVDGDTVHRVYLFLGRVGHYTDYMVGKAQLEEHTLTIRGTHWSGGGVYPSEYDTSEGAMEQWLLNRWQDDDFRMVLEKAEHPDGGLYYMNLKRGTRPVMTEQVRAALGLDD